MTPWSPADDDRLRHLYALHPSAEVARQLGRSKAAIKNRVNNLGLQKGHNCGCFRKGSISWNKGLHYQPGGRCAETQFKPGRPPELARNYLPIGSERISKDGYLERKISDDQRVAPARRWRGVHILIWEDEHGPRPKGHAVVFIDGDKAHIALDNLQLISRADLMRCNSVHARGPEIAGVSQLIGAITRQINKIERKSA